MGNLSYLKKSVKRFIITNMRWLKELYRKYYYISPLDLADSAESNRLFNLYWSIFWVIICLVILPFMLIIYRDNYAAHKYQFIFFGVAFPDLLLSFFLTIAVKNVDRKKAYIYKNIPIYTIYFVVGTASAVTLFYLQDNHFNGLFLFNAASCIILTVLTVSLAYILDVLVAGIIILPGVWKFWGAWGIFNCSFMIIMLLFIAFYNRYRLTSRRKPSEILPLCIKTLW